METPTSFSAALRDLRQTLGEVNRWVYRIDKRLVIFSWISTIWSDLQSLALFVLGGAALTHFFAKQQLDPLIVYGAIGAYAIFKTIEVVVNGYAREKFRLFSHALQTDIDTKRIVHNASLDIGRKSDQDFIDNSEMADQRGRHSIEELWRSQRELVSSVISVAVGSVLLLGLDPLLGVLAFFMAAPSIAENWFTETKRRELDESETLVRRQRREVREMLTNPIASVLALTMRFTEPFLAHYRALTEIVFQNIRIITRFEMRWNLFVGLATLVCMVTFGLYFSSRLISGEYTYLQVGAILGSFTIVANAIRTFGWAISMIETFRRNYHYLKRFFESKPLVDETGCIPVSFTATPTLSLERVTFTYPRKTRPAVENCSLVIKPGEKIALIGPNGCGKTTLMRLLLRVYAADHGRVCVDERSLAQVTQQSWLEHATMLTQAATLPGMEIVRAITGGPIDQADTGRLEMALRFASVDAMRTDLPYGLETWIGQQWPRGSGFSTGQLQRFAIAAAFYRILDPRIFVALFDEPTANCDAASKRIFFSSLTQAPELAEKTVIVSLHDALYLDRFDRVILMKGGTVEKDLRSKDEIRAYREQIELMIAEDSDP